MAAVAACEAGFEVTVHEARKEVGGRARTTPGERRANWGPHVVYGDGPFWAWLEERGLGSPAARVPLAVRFAFRVDGKAHLFPPLRMVKGAMRLAKSEAPADASFGEWAAKTLSDPVTALRIANFMGVNTFDHDPGRLSAAFVNERLRRGLKFPPQVRYVRGGWHTLAERLAARAREMGANIATGSVIDSLPPAPVILAVPLAKAEELLHDASLRWTGTRTALLDVGLRRRRGDPFVVSDLDASGWVEMFSRADGTLAPAGEQLVQAQAGLRPGETLDQGVERLEALLDLAYPRWRERETWRRRMAVEGESGALDLPGTGWRDRPRGDRGDGVYLVGDMVAAPGVLSEVSHRSALDAVTSLSELSRLRRVA